MKNTLLFLAVSVFSAAVITAQEQRPPQASDARSRDIYVSVVDSKGAPATGLTAADFTVREDGQAREVLRATVATEPLDIVLLIDDSQAATRAIPYLRDALPRFIDKMQGKASIGIVTFGERPTSVVERTSDAAALKKGVNRIFARPGSGAYLLDAIREVSQGFRKRETTRPHIVAIAIEGVEFSNLQYEQVLDALHESGATLHMLAVGTPSGSLSDEIRNKNIVMDRGTTETGGRRDQLLSELAIPDGLAKVADELLNQYVVTYGRPDKLIPPEKIEVTVNKPGLTARARTRLPDGTK
jgi:VWFA-related protein